MSESGAGNGVTRNIYEIFEIIMAVSLLLILSGAIFFVSKPEKIENQLIAKEISYVSTIVSSSDIEAELKYEDKKIEENGGIISVSSKGDDVKNTQPYFGQKVTIEEKEENVYLIRS